MYIQRVRELKPHQILLPASWRSCLQNIEQPHDFHYGCWQTRVTILIDEHLHEDVIGLPDRMAGSLTIPDDQSYELLTDQTHLHLGPVVAYMVTNHRLTRRLLKKYEDYLKYLHTFKGLIYLCSVKDIDPVHQSIRGYAFISSRAVQGKFPWVEGDFPYPGAVYRRTGLARHPRYRHLAAKLGDRIFNSVDLDKWAFREILSPVPLVGAYLPDTVRLTNLESLDQMLDKYGSVYLKPVKGSFGRGIRRADKIEGKYRIINREGKQTFFNSKYKLNKYLKRLKYREPYLVQQSVAFSHQNQNVDFRVIMQKNASKAWECSGIVARFGRKGRVFTNDISKTSLARNVLTSIFQLDEDLANHKVQEIISICKIASQMLEKTCGNYGDIGFDVAVDPHLRVWLLEMNFRQQPEIAVIKEDPAMFRRVISRPFEYARSLAGFSGEIGSQGASIKSNFT